MKYFLPLAVIVIFVLAAAAVLSIFFAKPAAGAAVCFGQNCFSAEVSKTPLELARGLMFKKSLEQDKGMLFIFDKEGIHPFWMKNTLIPLDIIWMDKDSRVVFIEKSAQPCRQQNCPTINPGVNAKYVLEVNAGTCAKIGIDVGDYGIIK